MILEVLPGKGRSITRVAKLVAAIKDWLFFRFRCTHIVHPNCPVDVTEVLRQIATLITDRPAPDGIGLGYDIHDGSPTVQFTGAVAAQLLVTKVASKVTQDRQNVRQLQDRLHLLELPEEMCRLREELGGQ